MGPSMHCVVAFLCAVLGSAASHSEVAPEMSQLGSTELCEHVLQSMEKSFREVKVPDIHRSANLLLSLLSIPYTLSQIQGQEGSCSKCTARDKTDSEMELSIANCNTQLTGKWEILNGVGPFVLNVKDMSTVITVKVTKDATENPSFEMVSCSYNGAGLDVTLSGTNSMVYQPFTNQVAKSLRSMMYSQACDETRKVISDLGEQLKSTQGSF